MLYRLVSRLKNPPPLYRGVPFYAWNGALDQNEIRRQVRIFKQMGLGGFFIHTRVGLRIPYLGREFMKNVRTAVDEAKSCGLKAWLYDEDRWPSGAAGGLVTRDKRFRMRALSFEKCIAEKGEKTNSENPDETTLAHYAIRFDREGKLLSYRRLSGPCDVLEKGETLYRFFSAIGQNETWFNDQAYLDMMNPEAVREFIRVTHEAYRRDFGEDFGRTIPGIFTDEPANLHHSPGLPAISKPWTDALPAAFFRHHGYDVFAILPELFFVLKDSSFSKARLDFFNTTTELFDLAFSQQIGEWCRKNRLLFTGHVMAEDTLIDQSMWVGSAMRFYEYMQAPGIDLLTEHTAIFDTARQCASAAHQFGRIWRLSETYGCTGWDFPFLGHKALGDWQFALGINLRCQHLAWYTMEGEAKRDYPASISFQSPWYKEYAFVEDYFARLNLALSRGEEQRDLLVIHPIESAWAQLPAQWPASAGPRPDLNGPLIRLRLSLEKRNLDFDYGDEALLAKFGTLSRTGPSASLRLAKARYSAVLLPEMKTIRSSTLDLLLRFRQHGGLVSFTGTPPECLDGIPSDQPALAYRAFTPYDTERVSRKLEQRVRRISVTNRDGGQVPTLLHLLRKHKSGYTLFVCNLGADTGENLWDFPKAKDRKIACESARIRVLRIPEDAKVFELHPESGRIFPVRFSRKKDNVVSFLTDFPPCGSRLFFITTEDLPVTPRPPAPRKSPKKLRTLDGPFRYKTEENNVLLLDHARFSCDGGPLQKRDFILNVDNAVRTSLGVRPRGGRMVQPWVYADRTTSEKTIPVELYYSFRCDAIPANGVTLALERPALYELVLNGNPLSTRATSDAFWCDPSLRRLSIPPTALKTGTNKLLLRTRYQESHPGFEAIYLLGDFGVAGDDVITMAPERLRPENLCAQGFPNYSGNLSLFSEFNMESSPRKNHPVFLEFPDFSAPAIGVRVNRGPLQMLAWAPYRIELTSFLKTGKNTLEIVLFNSRRNSHGPFYLNEEPRWHGHGEMRSYQKSDRTLIPFGLFAPPILRFD